MSEVTWFNGEVVSYLEAGLDAGGWPSGEGVFETIKTVNGLPWALSRHMRRALSAARRSDYNFANEELIRRAVHEIIAANPFPIGRMRLLFANDGALRVNHNLYDEITEPARLTIFENVISSGQIVEKRYPYDTNLAQLELAKNSGFDDGIFINDRGQITETAIANLLIQISGEWVTPPLCDGVLPGIMRALIIEKLGIKVRAIERSQLAQVSAGFVISSLKIAQPIAQIGEYELEITQESEQMRSLIAAMALATSVG